MRKNFIIFVICSALAIGLAGNGSHVHALDGLSKAEKSLDRAYHYIKEHDAPKAAVYLESAHQALRSIQDTHQNNNKF